MVQIVICDVINRLRAVSLDDIKDKVAALIFFPSLPPLFFPRFGRDLHIRLNYGPTARESKVTGKTAMNYGSGRIAPFKMLAHKPIWPPDRFRRTVTITEPLRAALKSGNWWCVESCL